MFNFVCAQAMLSPETRFSQGGKTKLFQSLRTTWPPCDKGPLRMFDCNTNISVVQTLVSVPLVSELGGLTVIQTPL